MEEGNWLHVPVPFLLFTSIVIFLVSTFFFFFILKKHENPKILPPGPPSLPILGHLHLLKDPFHRTLQELTSKYGDILLLRFGYRNILVVSSTSAVEECFTKYDVIFADRPCILASQILNCGSSTLGFSPYGSYWRNLRRFMTIEVFSSKSIALFSSIRQKEVYYLVKQLFDESRGKTFRVKMRSKLVDLAFNIVMRVLIGKRYSGKDVVVSEEGRRIKEIVKELGRLQGSASHLGDYIPILKTIDLQGVKKRMLKSKKEINSFLQHLLDVQRSSWFESQIPSSDIDDADESRSQTTCLIHRMLALQQKEPDFYTDETIKAVLQTMLVAGTDTTSTTAEWAFFLLLNHPEALAKAQDEIESIVGHDRLVDDSDIPNLTYLQNIINETLRLFPPVPLLLPHQSTEDTTICGFHVPRRTTLLVNTWSIHRDPELWADPEKFMPERFGHGSVESGYEGYKWIAFGVGRRACPAAAFGRRVLGLSLASMLQCFDWQRIGAEVISVAEGTGLTMPPAATVEALCKPREAMMKLLVDREVDDGGVDDP